MAPGVARTAGCILYVLMHFLVCLKPTELAATQAGGRGSTRRRSSAQTHKPQANALPQTAGVEHPLNSGTRAAAHARAACASSEGCPLIASLVPPAAGDRCGTHAQQLRAGVQTGSTVAAAEARTCAHVNELRVLVARAPNHVVKD